MTSSLGGRDGGGTGVFPESCSLGGSAGTLTVGAEYGGASSGNEATSSELKLVVSS